MIDNADFVALSDAEGAEIIGGLPWLKIYQILAAELESFGNGLVDGYNTART